MVTFTGFRMGKRGSVGEIWLGDLEVSARSDCDVLETPVELRGIQGSLLAYYRLRAQTTAALLKLYCVVGKEVDVSLGRCGQAWDTPDHPRVRLRGTTIRKLVACVIDDRRFPVATEGVPTARYDLELGWRMELRKGSRFSR